MPVPSALLSSDSVEWYTPSRYVDAARTVLDGIDLDPASCKEANRVVNALRYYTEADNGLQQSWRARTLWCNPPYGRSNGKSNQERWSHRLLASYLMGEIQEAILLVNAATEAKWFAPLWDYPLCFTDHRIHFTCPTRKKRQPTQGSVFVYFGPHPQRFADFFAVFGHIVFPSSHSFLLPITE